MSDRGGVFDPGLQPERTALAWRRTGLALAVGSIGAIRVLPELFAPVAVAPGALGLVLAIVVLALAERRYRSTHRRLMRAGATRVPLADGALPGLVALGTLALGVVGCAIVVAVALKG